MNKLPESFNKELNPVSAESTMQEKYLMGLIVWR